MIALLETLNLVESSTPFPTLVTVLKAPASIWTLVLVQVMFSIEPDAVLIVFNVVSDLLVPPFHRNSLCFVS